MLKRPHRDPSTPVSFLVLGLMVLLPWLWAYLGLFTFHQYWLAVALYAGLGCAIPVYFYASERHTLMPLGIPKWLLLLLIALGNTLMIGGWLLLSQNLFLWSELSQRFQAIGLANNISLGLFALYLIVFNPVVEEAFWRGLIYRNLRDRLGVGPALTLSSLFFGGWHFVIIQYFCPPLWAILLTCLVMAGGVVFGALYQRTGTLLAPILVHGLAGDLPIILILYGVLAQLPAT